MKHSTFPPFQNIFILIILVDTQAIYITLDIFITKFNDAKNQYLLAMNSTDIEGQEIWGNATLSAREELLNAANFLDWVGIY